MTTRLYGGKPYVKIAGKPYIVTTGADGKPAFSSSTRAIEQVPNDDFEIVQDDWSGGVGVHFYAGNDFLTIVKGKIYPRPTVTTINPVLDSDLIQDWFETGNYMYAIGNRRGYKFDISSTPALMREFGPETAVSPWVATDRMGQTALMYSARATAGYRRYVPLNSGARFMALDTVSNEASQAFSPVCTLNGAINASVQTLVYTSSGDPISKGDTIIIESERIAVTAVNTGTNTLTLKRGYAGTTAATHADTTAITQATPDTWSAVTAVTSGADNFQQMPDGKDWRSIASLSAGTAQNVAKVSALPAGADCEVNANWGAAFPVDDQTVPVIALMNYDELLIVGKQNGWFAAVQNSDGTLTWRNLLPDANLAPNTSGPGRDRWGRGQVWHGTLFLPTSNHLYRSTLSSAIPVGPDAIPENTGDEAAASANALRFGYISRVVGMGAWLYGAYSVTSTSAKVLAGREGQAGDSHQLPWGLMFKVSVVPSTTLWGSQAYIQKTLDGAPRLWVYTASLTESAFDWISLGVDGSPYSSALTYGNLSITARLFLMPHLFESNVLLNEFRYVIENGAATFTWGIEAARDGGSAAAVGSAVTATGSIYWTRGTADTCRRVQLILVGTAAAEYTPTATPPRVVRTVFCGSYLPKVSDPLLFTIDIEATADARATSQAAIRSELTGYRSSAQAWIDIYGTAGSIRVDSTQTQPPYQVAAEETMTVQGILLKYSG